MKFHPQTRGPPLKDFKQGNVVFLFCVCLENIIWELCEGWMRKQESERPARRENDASNSQILKFFSYLLELPEVWTQPQRSKTNVKCWLGNDSEKGTPVPGRGGD